MSPLPFLLAMESVKLMTAVSILSFLFAWSPPFVPAVVSIFASFALARLFRRFTLRRIWPVLAQLGSFALVAAGMVASMAESGAAGPGSGFLGIAACGLFWWRGLWLETKETGHAFRVARFDEGILLYLTIMSLSALTRLGDGIPTKTAPCFIAFSVIMLALSRNTHKAKEEGEAATGIFAATRSALSSIAAFALAALGLTAALPAMREPFLRTGTLAAGIFVDILRAIALFLGRLIRPRESPPPAMNDSPVQRVLETAENMKDSRAGAILAWIMLALIGIMFTLLAGYVLVLLARHLLGTPGAAPGGARGFSLRDYLATLLSALMSALRVALDSSVGAIIRGAKRRIGEARRPKSPAMRAWIRLLAVARGSGARKLPQETPREFASRLATLHPRAASEAPFIAESVELEAYAGQSPTADPARNERLRRARFRLRRAAFLAESASGSAGAIAVALKSARRRATL